MKKFSYCLCLLIWFALLQPFTAGAQSAYLKIADSDYVPRITSIDSSGFLQFEAVNSVYANLLNSFHIKEFNLAFPDIITPSLQDIYIVRLTSSTELELFMQKISLLYIEKIPLVEKCVEVIDCADSYYPNDSLYVVGELSYLDLIRAPEAWNIAKHYGKVKVGVNEAGFILNHPDVEFDTIIGTNVESNGGHGIIVSGLISAKTDNTIGIASTGGFNTKLIGGTNSILKLAQEGCVVINCSWHNGSTYSSIMDNLCTSIVDDYDCVLVFSAGNGAGQVGNSYMKLYPASYDACLSVTSIGYKYEYGHSANKNWADVHEHYIGDSLSTHQHNSSVDICAPGYGVRSTMLNGDTLYTNYSTGTSFAAPMVTGTAAMVRAVNPNLSAREVMAILKSTADASIYDIPGNSPYIGKLGTGRLDAYAAVRKACALDVADEDISSDTIYEDACIITFTNTTIEEGVNVEIHAVVETELVANFEVPLGSRLTIL